jgi:hypothetical protein
MKLEYLPAGSPDCPLIRLFDFTPSEANQLLGVISQLAEGKADRLAIHNLPFVTSVNGCQLSLCVRSWQQGVIQTAKPASFECGFPKGIWEDIAGLVEPFTREVSGFQWLAGVPGQANLLLTTTGQW